MSKISAAASKVFIRSSRRWMKDLAIDMGWDFISSASNQMSDLKKNGFIDKIIFMLKSSPLPPIEWFIPYEYIVKILPNDYGLIIEPGSRLIKTKYNYICYCENGLGIFGYNMKKVNRINIYLAKKLISDRRFHGFIFYSEASRKAAYSLLGETIRKKDLGVIFPYAAPEVDNSTSKSSAEFTIGFCSNLFILKSGREIIDAVINLIDSGVNLNLEIITKLDDIPLEYTNKIFRYKKNIKVVEFNLSKKEFFALASRWDIYLHCSYFDSCPLSIIEMQSIGVDIIATSNFAIPELLKGYSSKLIAEPKSVFNEKTFLPKENIFLDEFIIKNSEATAKYESTLCNEIEYQLQKTILEGRRERHPIPNHLKSEFILNQWKKITEKTNEK